MLMEETKGKHFQAEARELKNSKYLMSDVIQVRATNSYVLSCTMILDFQNFSTLNKLWVRKIK